MTSAEEAHLSSMVRYQNAAQENRSVPYRLALGITFFGWRYAVRLMARMSIIASFPTKTKLFWGQKLDLPVAFETRELFGFGMVPEPGTVNLLWKTISSRDIFYDIGANYGFFSWLAAAKGAEVHSFEPNPKISKYVNTGNPALIHMNVAAVSNTSEGVTFFPNEYSAISTTIQDVAEKQAEKLSPFHVPSITLDEYAKGHPAPTFIKIDIEGGEYNALKGGEQTLRAGAPVVVMEVWPGEAGKNYSEKAAGLLRGWGYQSYKIDPTGNLELADGNLSEHEDNYAFLKPNSPAFETLQKDGLLRSRTR